MAIPLTVITALSRPDRIPDVVANFRAQTDLDAMLLLVMNGPASESPVPCDPRITAIRKWGATPLSGSPAKPRNAGMEFARSIGGIVAFWDDDDYYSPGYLAEVRTELAEAPRRVVGRVVRFVEFDDGTWLFLRKQPRLFLGGTIAGWVNELPPIPDLSCHEDHEWCRLLERHGFELRTLSGARYIYNRRGQTHAWAATRTQMLHSYGPALAIGRQGREAVNGRCLGALSYEPRATVDDVEAEMLARLLARPVEFPAS